MKKLLLLLSVFQLFSVLAFSQSGGYSLNPSSGGGGAPTGAAGGDLAGTYPNPTLAIGSPAADGYLFTSTAAGARSWKDPGTLVVSAIKDGTDPTKILNIDISAFATATTKNLVLTSGGAVSVPSGGTGNTAFTTYAPIFGGTGGGGALQSGTVGTTGQVLTSNGAGAVPTFQSNARAATGANSDITSLSGLTGAIASPTQITLGASGILVGGTNLIEQRNGTNSQLFYLYNSFTDASNYSRLEIGALAGNGDLIIAAKAAGTGTDRGLQLRAGNTTNKDIYFQTGANTRWQIQAANGHFLAVVDNSSDIGASGATRPRNIFAAGYVTAARNVVAKTSNYTVLAAETNAFYTNTGAAGEVDFTLPTAAAGLTYSFYVDAAQTVKIICPSTATIQIAASATTGGGNTTNATTGGAVTIVCITSGASGKWVAQSHEGTWTLN